MVFEKFKIIKTIIYINFALTKNQGQSKCQLYYDTILIKINIHHKLYQTDIACAISKLSQYISNHDQIHWMTKKWILGYLKYNQDMYCTTIDIA